MRMDVGMERVVFCGVSAGVWFPGSVVDYARDGISDTRYPLEHIEQDGYQAAVHQQLPMGSTRKPCSFLRDALFI